ncbi:MAG: ATP-binding cassette domain-containing protein [Planctomycetota bacterium]
MVQLDDISIRYRGPTLLDGVSARIHQGDRIGLLGRNGAGKTTLMKIIEGCVHADSGARIITPKVNIARLIQEVPDDVTGSVREVILNSDHPGQAGAAAGSRDDDPESYWRWENVVDKTITQMSLDPDAVFESMSSGMKRRVLLASAIAAGPDILLLDEPTNHLDIESIGWLENFLSKWNGTFVFITHDRRFLQNLATRIWEIDRGRLFDWTCDYPTFLLRKQQAIEAEEKQNALFDKKLAEEEAWIRQGIKARRTRNEGRVRALKAMRLERSDRRAKVGKAKLNFGSGERSGALVAELEDVRFRYADDQPELIGDFSTQIMRGDRVGILGPNGAGKSTLLRLILGKLEPTAGTIRQGTRLNVAYFDQLRESLDPEASVADNVGEGGDRIQIGDTSKHIYGYLQDFLFTPERARSPVKFLSGGERNRALLAKLMTRPANLLVLDEPTNDLDYETLELLEEQLLAFDGTVLLVSHDREFLNNVVSSVIEVADGNAREYFGGYDDYLRVRNESQAATSGHGTASGSAAGAKPIGSNRSAAKKATTRETAAGESTTAATSVKPARKLSFKEKSELEALPGRIETLEADIAALHQAMADPAYFQNPDADFSADRKLLAALHEELDAAYAKWEELEG